MAEQDVTHTLVKLDGVTARQINQNFRDVQEFVNGQTVHVDGTGLAAALGAVLTWQAWTPSLTAATTNPTLGTNPTTTGRFIRFGDVVVAHATIGFGFPGAGAGNGIYSVSLPVNCATGNVVVGSALLSEWSPVGFKTASCFVPAADLGTVLLYADSGTAAVSNGAPWTWAALDGIRIHVVYEAG